MEDKIGLTKLKITDHPSQLSREKVECWLKEFLPKLKRTTSRTQKCRLLESVERLDFENDRYAGSWKLVKFDKEGRGTIYNGKNRKLEEFEQTNFQKQILQNDPSLIENTIGRWEIKEESGDWQLDDDLEKVLSRGGEAIVLAENFDVLETAVRVQVFDPFIFTEEFEENGFTCEIHLSKEFEPAKQKSENEESSEAENQMPYHKNVIHNFVNVELFHGRDEKRKDCLGWITIMERGEANLRTLLKEEKIDLEKRKKIANGILDGYECLWSRGIHHHDLKLENVLLVGETPKLIDFGLVRERSGRKDYRKMGYARRGTKYKTGRALTAGTPGFTSQAQIAIGAGYTVFNLYYFLFCDWKTAWTLLYQPLDHGQREEIDKIVEKCGAASIKKLNQKPLYISTFRNFFSEVTKIISLKNASTVFCLDDPNLTQSCKMSSLKQNATKCVNQNMQNLTKNVFDQKTSQLCVPISITTLLRHAIKNDLAFEDEYGHCTFEKILATLTMIVFPRSLAGLNLNPNKKEKEKQENEIEILLNRLCKETYLMGSGWQIIRGVYDENKSYVKDFPPKSSCQISSVTLNENFTFTRPATVTGAYLPSTGDLLFHQMTLDRVENGQYVLQNSDFKDHSPVLRIPLKSPYYASPEYIFNLVNQTECNVYQDDEIKLTLVNQYLQNMDENTWYLLPTAYTTQLISE